MSSPLQDHEKFAFRVRQCALVLGKAFAGLSFLALLVAVVPSTKAAVLVSYTFSSTTYASGTTNPDLTSSLITQSGSFTSDTINTTVGNPLPSMSISTIATNSSSAFTDNTYFTFTLTPVLSSTFSLTSLTLDLAHTWTNSATEGFDVYTSVDGFSSTANIVGTGTRSVSGANVFQTMTIDLSAAQFQNLTSALTFRLYAYDGGTVSTSDQLYDNITINGVAVPEPSSAALMSLGTLGAMIWRRKTCRENVKF